MNDIDQEKKDKEAKDSNEEYEILPDNYPVYDLSFKVIIIGNSGVGKSCLALRATKNVYKEQYLATIGFEYFTFMVKINGKIIKMQVWDTCGQEIYKSLVANFYKSASLAIIVYSISDRKSFDDIPEWINEVKKNSNPDIQLVLVGNKYDLGNLREVSTKEAQKLQNEMNFLIFLEISAKTGFNAREIFVEAAKLLYNKYNNYLSESSCSEDKIDFAQRRGSKIVNQKNTKKKCC